MTRSAAHDPKSVAGRTLAISECTQVLVVGAGPAGLSAAIESAKLGMKVMLVDENPISVGPMGEDVPLHFGQAFTTAARNRNVTTEEFVASESLFEAAYEAGVDVRLGTCVWGLYANGPSVGWMPGPIAALADEDHSWLVGCDRLIVATGRRDMGLAFPGWELPRVLGATAAQRLAERYRAIGVGRVVMLGTSTETLVVALALLRCGVQVAAIVEHAPEPVGVPDLVAAVASSQVEILTGHVVHEAVGRDGVEGVVVGPVDAGETHDAGGERYFNCDGVVIGIGTTPVIELLDALGCRVAFQAERGGYAPVDHGGRILQRTTVHAFGTAGQRVRSVQTDRGIFDCDQLVIAAGPQTGALAAMLGIDVPMAAARAEMIVTEPLPLMPYGGVDGNGLYGRQTLRGNLAYGGGPHEWLSVSGMSVPPHTSTPLMRNIARRLARLLPGASHARVIRSWAGLIENTPDGRPIIDRATAPENVILATLSSVGFGLSPASGRVIRDLVIDGACSFADISSFKLSRFDELEPNWRELQGWKALAKPDFAEMSGSD